MKESAPQNLPAKELDAVELEAVSLALVGQPQVDLTVLCHWNI